MSKTINASYLYKINEGLNMLFLNKQTNCKELDKFNLLQEIEETLLSYRIDGINNRDNFILFAIKLNQIEKSKTNFRKRL